MDDFEERRFRGRLEIELGRGAHYYVRHDDQGSYTRRVSGIPISNLKKTMREMGFSVGRDFQQILEGMGFKVKRSKSIEPRTSSSRKLVTNDRQVHEDPNEGELPDPPRNSEGPPCSDFWDCWLKGYDPWEQGYWP